MHRSYGQSPKAKRLFSWGRAFQFMLVYFYFVHLSIGQAKSFDVFALSFVTKRDKIIISPVGYLRGFFYTLF